MSKWQNKDGVLVKFGNTEGEVAKGGAVKSYGNLNVAEFEIDMATLPNITAGVLYLSDTLIIPAGAIVQRVVTTIHKVSVGSGANFNLGLRKAADRAAYDDDGLIIAADAEHTTAVGTRTKYEQGGTDHGATLGIILTEDSFIVASYDTAAFTAGIYKVRIEWYVPRNT